MMTFFKLKDLSAHWGGGDYELESTITQRGHSILKLMGLNPDGNISDYPNDDGLAAAVRELDELEKIVSAKAPSWQSLEQLRDLPEDKVTHKEQKRVRSCLKMQYLQAGGQVIKALSVEKKQLKRIDRLSEQTLDLHLKWKTAMKELLRNLLGNGYALDVDDLVEGLYMFGIEHSDEREGGIQLPIDNLAIGRRLLGSVKEERASSTPRIARRGATTALEPSFPTAQYTPPSYPLIETSTAEDEEAVSDYKKGLSGGWLPIYAQSGRVPCREEEGQAGAQTVAWIRDLFNDANESDGSIAALPRANLRVLSRPRGDGS
jgi:hypothetical protein